jgi:hypothetical protein
MKRDEATELIDDLQGDEYNWVDFKQDYYILGVNIKKSEFIQDIAAMSNTMSKKDTHYIIVGVDDESGDLVGVSDDYNSFDGPSHILSLDDAKLQNTISDYLSPTPNITIHKYTDTDPIFGLLEINPIKKKPCVIDSTIESGGNVYLQKGLVYTRYGSRNTIARRSELEEILDERIHRRREEILEGITKATEIGPEAVAKVGEFTYEEEGDITIDIGEEADFVFDERISREPVSDLDSQLDQDISQWASHENTLIGKDGLWSYYSSPDEITIDEEAVAFLTHASIDNGSYGIYWLSYVGNKKRRNILNSIPKKHHNNVRVAEVFSAFGDTEGLIKYCGNIGESTGSNPFGRLIDVSDKSSENRQRELVSQSIHDIGYKDWSKDINMHDVDLDQAKELISELSSHLPKIQSRMSGMDSWYEKRENFQQALCDLEIVIATISN